MAHLVIGTSGHIDHGKSALVMALTGTDPDRWAEEKARGITIDLGFAHLALPGGVSISLVDVPGHERFVHNMLAGAGGMDAVLLVVAADRGVMPQTREHLAITQLLGVPRGLVVLTRTDLADPALLPLVTEEVAQAVQGTYLEGAPVVPVSSRTGQGLDELKRQLALLAQSHQNARAGQAALPFRLPIDRVFSVKGFGTVVTGTVVTGTMATSIQARSPRTSGSPTQNKGGTSTPSESVMVYPGHRLVRVRGLQAHGQPVDSIQAGMRAALNLAGVDTAQLARGHQLAAPGSLLESRRFNARVKWLATAPPLPARTRVHVHVGTAVVLGRLVLLESGRPPAPLQPGATALAQLRLEAPLAARHGDRFVLRGGTPLTTLGGGVVLDPDPAPLSRWRTNLPRWLPGLEAQDPAPQLEAALALQGLRGMTLDQAPLRTGLSEKAAQAAFQALSSQGALVQLNPETRWVMHQEGLAQLTRMVTRHLEAAHRLAPDAPGLTPAELTGKMAPLLDAKTMATLLQIMARQGVVEAGSSAPGMVARGGQTYHLPGQPGAVNPGVTAQLAALCRRLEQDGATPLRRGPLLAALGWDEKTGAHLFKTAQRAGLVVAVKPDLFYAPGPLEALRQALQTHFALHPTLTVVEFKDLCHLPRKHAVDVLEYFDGLHLTLRVDNHRVLRK